MPDGVASLCNASFSAKALALLCYSCQLLQRRLQQTSAQSCRVLLALALHGSVVFMLPCTHLMFHFFSPEVSFCR